MNNVEDILEDNINDNSVGMTASSSAVIPVIDEQLQVGKQQIETGKLHVIKKVTQEEYNADIPLFKEEVSVERKRIDQYIDGEAPGIRVIGDTTIIPVLKEVVVKRLLLVEEVHITKNTVAHSVPVHDTIRHEEVVITCADNRDKANPVNE